MGILLVLNVHGAINTSAPVRQALEELKVVRKFTATVVTDDPATVGMLKLCKNHLAWAPMEPSLLSLLLERRGKVSTEKPLDAAGLKKMGFKSHEDLAKKMVDGGLRLSAIPGVRPFFRLAPPRGGFKQSGRLQYQERGLLGSNPGLGDIVRRML